MLPDRSHALDKIIGSITKAIARGTHPQFGLMDPVTGKPTPPDHYGQTCAALAICSLPSTPSDCCNDALQAWLNTSNNEIDHLPFNRLALNLMLNLHHNRLSQAYQVFVRQGIKRCELHAHYPSNNWTLLAATCRLIEAPVKDRPCYAQALAEMLQKWTTAKGAFIDFPAKPQSIICTPIAYHHKALFLCALALRFCSHANLARQTLKLFNWLEHCWDEAGYAGGFGRSNHSLFGDSCLIAALILLDLDERGPVDRIATRLMQQMRPDGFLWLDPWGPREGARHWDSYMHLSVYNAWAAAIIQSARLLRVREPVSPHLNRLQWKANRAGLHHDDEAGLASWRDESGNVALISTKGQPPQVQTQGIVDLRYAGGRIYHLSIADTPPQLLPGFRGLLPDFVDDPKLGGATPIVAKSNCLGSIDTYKVIHLEQTINGFILELEGYANVYHITRPEISSLFDRLLAGIDWRFLNGRLRRAATLKRTSIPGLSCRLSIELDKNVTKLTVSRNLYLPSLTACWCVNPHIDQLSQLQSSSDSLTRYPSEDDKTHRTTTLPYYYKAEESYDLISRNLNQAPPQTIEIQFE